MNNPYLLLTISLFIIFLILGIIISKKIAAKKRRKKFLKNIPATLKKIKDLPSPQKILEYDKVLHLCLQSAGYKGTTGNMMKRYGKNFVNQNDIWYSHKARNRLAHELNISFSEKEQKNIEKYFLREIKVFL